jgi:two-component system CheB/CheR fusion protein
MPRDANLLSPEEQVRLLDEIEQLRTALESSLDENSHLIEDRDRLRNRVTMLAREMQAANVAFANSAAPAALAAPDASEAEARHSQTEEELRVAFEELQVLAEELEVANSGLSRANEELESRVKERTREIAATSAELSRSELRFRTLIEGMPQLVWRSADGGNWTWSSPQWIKFTGQSMEESLGHGWLDAFHPEDRAAARAAWAEADSNGRLAFEGRICQARDNRYRHFQTRALAVRLPDDSGREWLGTSTDVDDILRLQERQAVLVGELQHRTRNLMAVLQSVTLRTIRGSRSLEEFREQIDARMQALARVQGVLSRRDAGNRVAFDTLLREELSAHVTLDADGNGAQVTTEGPTGIPLESSLVQTFALALHELATNAVKYGALAHPEGRLSVHWEEVRRNARGTRLLVDWRESGVAHMPDKSAAARGGGYGRELIERALPYQLGAATCYDFSPGGVHCTIEVDIPEHEPGTEAFRG